LLAPASEITFDSGLTNTQVITSGYGGLNWDAFAVRDTSEFRTSGYNFGTISQNFVAYNTGDNLATISSLNPFSLVSAYLTAGWRDNLQLTVAGYFSNQLVSSSTCLLSSTAPSLINFNLGKVDSVTFISSGGTNHGFGGSKTNFVMDNLTVTAAVPEPETYAMLLAGLGIMATVAGRRNARV
jgi:hypothetical protein